MQGSLAVFFKWASPSPRTATPGTLPELLEQHFVQLRRDVAVHQTNQIATALGTLTQQSQAQYDEGRLLWADNLRHLLITARKPNEAQLTAVCPFWAKLTEVPKAQRLGVLDSHIHAAMEAKGHSYLPFPTSALGFSVASSCYSGIAFTRTP